MKRNIILTAIAAVLFFGVNTTSLKAQDGDFKPSGNLWGYVFGDYAYKTHNDTLQRGGGAVQYRGTGSLNSANATQAILPTDTPAQIAAKNEGNAMAISNQTNAFQIRRAYLGYDYQFAKNFSARVVMANEQNFDASGKNTFYLKYANVKWMNLFKGTDLVVGQYETCSFANAGNTEQLWSYRSSERTIMDLHNIDASSDLGISLQGKVMLKKVEDSLKPALLNYALQVGNGNSASPETDVFKKFRGNVSATFLKQMITVGVYGDYVNIQYSPYHQSNTTMKVYAAFKTDKFRVGVEAFTQTNKNSDRYQVATVVGSGATGVATLAAVSDTTNGMQMGWSVFASGTILKSKKTSQAMLSIFGRIDMYNPDTKWNVNNQYAGAASGIKGSDLTASTFYKQTFINAGIDWCPNPRVHFMPNIWYSSYKTNMSTSAVGGTGNDLGSRVKMDNDLVYRLTFYYVFNGSKKVMNNGMNY